MFITCKLKGLFMHYLRYIKFFLVFALVFSVFVESTGNTESVRDSKQATKREKSNVVSVRSDNQTKPMGRYDGYNPDDPLVKPGEAKPSIGEHKPNPDGDYVEIKDEPDEIIEKTTVDTDFNGGKLTPEDCTCVPYYQCDDGYIVTDGSGLIDPKIPLRSTTEIPLDAHYKPPYCGTFHVCCSEPKLSTQTPYKHRCGIRNPSGINRRVLYPRKKGESHFGEWPWQAAVLKKEENVNLFQCGGVLIDELHVLTVAHCVYSFVDENRSLLKVRLGEWDTQQSSEFLPHEDYNVVSVVIHPGYNNGSLRNDIALLKLDRIVVFAPNIGTICLPRYADVFDGQQCVTTGWGKNAFRGGSYSNILKEVGIPIIPYLECQEKLRKTRLGLRFELHESFICAGGENGHDSCTGDGGGPLTCYGNDGTYALVGLVSWGIDCGTPGVPGVYVKVQKYLHWITKVTGSNIIS